MWDGLAAIAGLAIVMAVIGLLVVCEMEKRDGPD